MRVTRVELKPLGDTAILAYLPDEASAFQFANAVRGAQYDWLLDVVPAYASVGVFFDPERIARGVVRRLLGKLKFKKEASALGCLHQIPCCYELQLDLARVAEHRGVTPDRVIELHTSQEFTVYAIGFSPGFPYLGYLPRELEGVPRLPAPRLRVEPGSVGLTARQTGIYPLARPGGWNIIGRTPLELVHVEDGYFPIRIGDRVQFHRIDDAEHEHLKGERLSL
ncbi:MAG: allophanate hydrolase subunit 1 [Gemmataceae bacterium]|nr:allophanate hydrolase subunit 1 [Gemmataceae bacterium]